MNINDLTLGQIKEITKLAAGLGGCANPSSNPFQVGTAYLIRTVTMAWCGRVSAVSDQFLTLEHAAWVADTGRYHKAVADGASALTEVEPVTGPAIVAIGSIVDAVEWKHTLPLIVK